MWLVRAALGNFHAVVVRPKFDPTFRISNQQIAVAEPFYQAAESPEVEAARPSRRRRPTGRRNWQGRKRRRPM